MISEEAIKRLACEQLGEEGVDWRFEKNGTRYRIVAPCFLYQFVSIDPHRHDEQEIKRQIQSLTDREMKQLPF